MALLAASGQIELERLGDVCLLGEFALDGSLRSVHGVLPSPQAPAARHLLGGPHRITADWHQAPIEPPEQLDLFAAAA